MRAYAWPFLAAFALLINACGNDQAATDAGVDGGGAGRGGSGGRGGSAARGGSGGSTAGSNGGSTAGTDGGTAGSNGGSTAGTGVSTAGTGGSTGGSTAGTGGGTAGSTGGSTGGSTAGRGGSTAGTGGGSAGTGGSTAGTGGRGGGSGGSTAGTGGGTAGSTGGSTAGTGGGSGGSTAGTGGGSGGSTAGTTGTAGSTGGSTAGTTGTAGSTGGSSAGTGGSAGGTTGTGGGAGTGGGGIACSSPSTCPGGADDECKHKTCISNLCGMDFTAANTSVTGQSAGDCKHNVCDGVGGVMAAIDDADPPADDGNACTSETCMSGIPNRASEPVRTPCSQNGGSLCNGSSSAPACVACVAATDCPGTDSICHQRVCGNQGTCGFANATAGTAAEADATGNCKKAQCDGLGGTTAVNDDSDTPADDSNSCTDETCATGTPSHPAKANGTTCSQGGGTMCVGGTCGQCQTVADCPGSDTLCRMRTCETNHFCGQFNQPQGTGAGADAIGNCRSAVCDGSGNIILSPNDSDLPVDGIVCTRDLCTNGTPTNPPQPVGTICVADSSKACDAGGSCNPLTFRVVRVGTGAAALGSGATAVFVEERKLDGTLVNTVDLPTAPGGTHFPLTMSGSATSEGALSLSADGHYVVLAGYAATPGTLAVSGTTAAAVNRVAGKIDSDGNIDTSTYFTSACSGNNVRAAASTDGTELWIAGAGGGTFGGVWYNTRGSFGTETRVLSTPNNVRVVAIFGNQLFGSSGSSPFTDVFRIGFGTPTTMGQTATVLPGMPTMGASPFQYVVFDLNAAISGMDTLYVADDATGIIKWTFDGATWTQGATLNAQGSTGFRGVAGYAASGTVTLMATTAETTANRLVVIVDDGVNAPSVTPVGSPAPTNTIFRGVAVSPHFPAP